MFRNCCTAAALCAALLLPTAVWACASCSAGGDDPLVLYPNETWKVYVGLGRQAQFTYLKPDGTPGTGFNPDTRDMMLLAGGYAITPQVFVTLALPMVRNATGDEAAWGLGDLSLAGRWTLVQQDFDAPWVPQVQLLGGLRNAVGHSGFDFLRDDGLDEFGTGIDEGRVGVDVWFGMFAWKLGAAAEVLWPFGRSNWLGQWFHMAPTLRTLVSAGVGVESWGRLMVSLVRDAQGNVTLDGQPLPNSGKTVYSVAAALDVPVTEQGSLRASVARLAAFGSHNVNQATSMGLAYMHAW